MLEREKIERIEKELVALDKKISRVAETLESRKQNLGFSDLIQELTGAVILAFPFAANADIWEISKNMSDLHVFVLLVSIVSGFLSLSGTQILETGRFKILQDFFL